jgi:hypothetical protein
MSRYERKTYFEALCEMRDRYADLSDDDRIGTLLIDDAMVYAEAVMVAIEAELAEEIASAERAAEEQPANELQPGPRD